MVAKARDARRGAPGARARAGFAALLLARMSIGCSGGECPTLEACDIRSSSCQDRTREVAACLRGGGASSTSVQVVDKEAFIAEKVRETSDGSESADQRDFRRGMALLALMPESTEAAETVREYWTWVGAFYSSEEKAITVLDGGMRLDGAGSVILLLHEMIHAIQDADVGLDRSELDFTYDEALAFRGMIEGEAVLYQDLATLEGYGRDPDETDWNGIFGQFTHREWRNARANASPYELAAHRFAYAFGGGYVNRAWRSGGNAAVRDIFAAIPSSTREVLAGYGAPPRDGAPWKEDPDEVGMPILPAEYQHVDIAHLGAWLFAIWNDLHDDAAGHSTGFVDFGFAGDVVNVFRVPATGDVAVVWRLRFGTPEQAAAVVASIAPDPLVTIAADGRDAIIAADTRGAPPESFVRALAWRAVTPADSADPPNQAAFLARPGVVSCGAGLPSD